MIKVLHVVHHMNCGGIETMLMNIYRFIDRDSVQFDFLVNGFEEHYYSREIESLGGNVIKVTPKRVNLFKNIMESISVMKSGNYDIVHIHQDSMISIGIFCAKQAGIKNIITHAHTTSANGWYRKLLSYISRDYILKNSKYKLACSIAASRWIYGDDVNDCHIFHNAINAEKFKFEKTKCINNKQIMGISKDTFVFGTCGRLSVEKNQVFLVDILQELKQFKKEVVLVLVGDGSEKNRILEKADKLGLSDSVIITGFVSDTCFYYSVLDAFILPSFFEGLPLAGIEAQAAGLTCFFSNGITRDLKIVKNAYFIDLSKGAKYWAEKIMECSVEKEDTYDEVVKAGYDIKENVITLEKIYKYILISNRWDSL